MLDTLLTTPRIRLAELPTPVQYCQQLTAYLGGPRIYIKRDDLTGLGLGGNKARKLEFVLADALGQGADTVVSAGALPHKNLPFSDSVLVSPPRPHLRSSTLEQEKHMVFVREKEEDVS